jgi:cyclophilin family peptidyl-prolyl cis-trans isomerase
MNQSLKLGLIFTLLAALMAGCQDQSETPDQVQPETSPAEIMTDPAAQSDPVTAGDGNPVVVIETGMGNITVELWADQAPITVDNFLSYVDEGHFDELTFHRVIPGFMIQGGGFDYYMGERETQAPITNEARADLRNDRGTIAMARTNVVDSATSQFFINLVDNDFLNHVSSAPNEFGYAVFGEVIEGMDVAEDIAVVPTTNRRGHQNVPVEPVLIESIRRQ